MTASSITLVKADHVATLTIDRPPVNAMSVDLARELADALESIDADNETRAIVLRAKGKAFCAGADLSKRADEIGIQDKEDEPKGNPLYDEAVRLYATKKPIVAAIHGPAVGAGLGLALVADFRIASPSARFVANFTALGFHPGFGLTHTLPRLIGQQRATLMFLTSRRIKGDEAVEWGLADEVVYDDLVHDRAHELAAEIARNAPLALMSTRATLRADLADAVRQATNREFTEQQRLMKTNDFAEGVKAVAERRPGRFTGS